MNATFDQWGSEVLVIRKENLNNFPAFISLMRDKGYGRTGVIKARLHSDDRNDLEMLHNVLRFVSQQFDMTIRRGKRVCYVYNPEVQMTCKASITDDVYEYVKYECHGERRKNFVAKACAFDSYVQSLNCCVQALKLDGCDGLRRHCFDHLRRMSPLNVKVNEKVKKGIMLNCDNHHTYLGNDDCSFVLNGPGICCEDPINICGDFSMGSLTNVLDCVDEKYDGITYPYIYCGTAHSIFPWQIGDVGLFSISYLVGGSPKLWFAIPPDYFGLADHICDGFSLDNGNSGCKATLAYHKVIVADPEYFKSRGCPYVVLVQEPGDFVITFPFALYSGINLGDNVAMYSNFADKEWIPLGLYAPRCVCSFSDTIVHLNMASILEEHCPDISSMILAATALDFPPSHPRTVRWECRVAGVVDQRLSSRYQHLNQQKSSASASKSSPKGDIKINDRTIGKKLVGVSKARTLYCPKCNQSFAGNKMSRLLQHISVQHGTEMEKLKEIVAAKYKPWQPKTSYGFLCNVCGQLKLGSVTHLKKHHMTTHSTVPFQKPLKCVSAVAISNQKS